MSHWYHQAIAPLPLASAGVPTSVIEAHNRRRSSLLAIRDLLVARGHKPIEHDMPAPAAKTWADFTPAEIAALRVNDRAQYDSLIATTFGGAAWK